MELVVVPHEVRLALSVLQTARWAADAFARYDAATVREVVASASEAAAVRARALAGQAVAETGFGVVDDAVRANVEAATGTARALRGRGLVDPIRHDGTVLLPRPAGVVVLVTPAAAAVSVVTTAVLTALAARDAVVVFPHPAAAAVTGAAVDVMAAAAVAAGAPAGCVQRLDPSTPEALLALTGDDRVDLVLHPGAPGGHVPVLVDRTADLAAAARCVADGASFDNAAGCWAETVLVVEDAVADDLVEQLHEQGAHLLDPAERDLVSALLFPDGAFDPALTGRDASWLAGEAGVRVRPSTRLLLAPLDLALPDDPLTRPTPCPVLPVLRVPDGRRGVGTVRTLLRSTGAGGSAPLLAAVHSATAATVLAFGAAVGGARVAVDSVAADATDPGGLDPGALDPGGLVRWTRVAGAGPGLVAALTDGPGVGERPHGPVPAEPVASNAVGAR